MMRRVVGRTRQPKSPSSIPRSQWDIIGPPLLYRPSFLFSSSRSVLLFLRRLALRPSPPGSRRCDWEHEQENRLEKFGFVCLDKAHVMANIRAPWQEYSEELLAQIRDNAFPYCELYLVVRRT